MNLLVTLASIITMSGAHGSDGLHCVLTGDAYDKPAETIDYKGIRYGTCCGGCGGTFIANPEKLLAEDVKKNILVGVSLFDPVSGARIEARTDTPTSVYKGVRYLFSNADEKKTFDDA